MEFERLLPERPGGLYYVRDRHPIFWAGWSMVEAELMLLSVASQYGPFERYQLLSGSCYPIASSDELFEQLCDPSRPELCIWHGYSELTALQRKRVTKFHFHDFFGLLTQRGVPSSLVSLIRSLNRIVGYGLPFCRDVPNHLRKGSQWWCFREASVNRILMERETPAFERLSGFFRYCSAPDELFFSSLLLEDVRHVFGSPITVEHLNHHIEWRNKQRPSVLVEESFVDLLASASLFCRKVSLPESRPLLDKLDAFYD